MLVLNPEKNIKELEKYGFKILVDDEELKKNMEEDSLNFFCTRAVKGLGNHFNIVIENDGYECQVTIVPDKSFGLNLCIDWQLDILYQLIKDEMLIKFEEE